VTKLGAQACITCVKAIGTCLKSKADNLLERSSYKKVDTMMATFDRPDKEANVHQRKCGENMLPRLLGYFPYIPVGRTVNVSEPDKELQTRNTAFETYLESDEEMQSFKEG
jgi:hypothetical protein